AAALQVALPAQRWFAGKSAIIKAVVITDAIPIEDAWIVLARVATTDAGDGATSARPLPFLTNKRAAAARHDRPASVLAELEIAGPGGTGTGVCVDACVEPAFGRALLDAISRRRRIASDGGHLVGSLTRPFASLREEAS